VPKSSPHLIIGRLLALALLVSGLGAAWTALVPIKVGNVDWEFGSIGELAAVGGLPVMGLVAALAISMYERRRWAIGLIGAAMLLFGLIGFSAMGLLATDTPMALEAAKFDGTGQGDAIRIVLAKSFALLLLFSVGLIGTGVGAIRMTQRGR
jgi:hypothetical protein